MIVLKLILFTLYISGSYCRHPDKVYCANEGCDEPISKAKTLLSYSSPDSDLISFRGNSEALIYMKSAGTNSDLWFVSINGKSGFVNSRFLREFKILERNPQFVVPYEPKTKSVQPDKVQQAHEVIDGTTIYTTEAAVNSVQQDTTTEAPVTALAEDVTPSLGSTSIPLNDNIDTTTQNDSSEDVDEVSENGSEEDQSLEISEPSKQGDTPIVNNEGEENMESSAEAASELPEEGNNSSEQNDASSIEQLNQELPKELPTETAQQVISSHSASLNSEPLLNIVDNNSLPESENPEKKEQNVSTPNNNVESVQPPQESSSKSNNALNGDVNPSTEPADQTMETVSSAISDSVNVVGEVDNDVTNVNGVQANDNATPLEPLPVQPEEPSPTINAKLSESETVPPIDSPPVVGTVPSMTPKASAAVPSVPPETVTVAPPPSEEVPVIPSVSESVPVVPPPTEVVPIVPPSLNGIAPSALDTVPAVPPPDTVPVIPPPDTVPVTPPPLETIPVIPPIYETIPSIPITTETIPALYPQENQVIAAPETIAANINAGQSANQPQKIPPLDAHSTPSPYSSTEETNNQQFTTESTLTQDLYPPHSPYIPEEVPTMNSIEEMLKEIKNEPTPTTEAPVQDENTEGFFSNVYTTVADMWPSSTETPPIYNTEEYPSYESYKTEKAGVNEGFSFMKYILSAYYSVMGVSEESKELFASVGGTCYTDEYCDGTSNDGTNRLLTFLLTTASSVLLFTLGYYYLDNRRQDGRFIGQINSLQRDLLFATKECEILKEELTSTKNKLAGIEDSSFGMDDMVQSLKEEINELKATNERLRNSLDDNEKLLRVSENTAGELQNTLSEVENTISDLLAERASSEEHIVELNGKLLAFEEELMSVRRERDNFHLKYASAESALEEFKKQKKQLEDINQQLAEAKNTIELQKHEIDALKDAIKELKSGMPSNVDVTSLIDHTEIKAKLSKALEEKKSFETKYEVELKERTRLAEELQSTQETLHTTSQNATEALTRLDVLGKYFQERESELMKELSSKESLWLSKQGESASTVEKIELLQQEVQRFKEKCDALTLELAEQESSRRTALSAVETRAHAAWLEARASKRDADAARDEAAALRRKLAALSTVSTADGAVSPHHKVSSPLDSVENPVIPPPLPPMFLPPPLLPPLPRPPPLGRLPSPHPPRYGDRRYSPDSRYSPESRYSPDSRYSPETVRYSPESRYSPRTHRSPRSPYSPRSRRRSRSRERYEEGRGSRARNGPADTETEYNSDSPTREPRRRGRYSRHSGPSSGSGCSSESDK